MRQKQATAMTGILVRATAMVLAFLAMLHADFGQGADRGLVGFWKLQGDCLDHSGRGHHGKESDRAVLQGLFHGAGSHVEVPSSPDFDFGTTDFSIAAWVKTDTELKGEPGDLVTKFDPARRQGFHLTVHAGNPGYNAQSNVRHLFFGVDNGTVGRWTDCGRPGGKTHNSDALTVFEGDLYAGTTDGPDEADWAHVYRFRDGTTWEDCGRLGDGRTRGVYAMVVHAGALYAATSASHGPQPATMAFGRVYRYRGGKDWEDIGQPGENYRLNSLASFRGKLYVTGFNIGPALGHCYVYSGDRQWQECGAFEGWPHTLLVHDDRLYAAYPKGEVFAFDGGLWQSLGNPLGSTQQCSQIHAMGVFRGELFAGCWPSGKVAVRRGGHWIDLGRLGDAIEVVGLTAYNGGFFAGTIPRAELFRWESSRNWSSIRRLFDPPGFQPVPVGSSSPEVADWSRASSMAVFRGQLFVSTATCYRTHLTNPIPDEPRGRVFSYATGGTVSWDRDLTPGDWQHLSAVRRSGELRLYVDGRLRASSNAPPNAIDVSNNERLQIGLGPQSFFRGRIAHVRLYDRALRDDELSALSRSRPATLE